MQTALPTLPAHLLAILSGAVKLPERASAIAAPRVAVRAPATVTRAPGYLPDMPEIEAHEFGAIESNDCEFLTISQGL